MRIVKKLIWKRSISVAWGRIPMWVGAVINEECITQSLPVSLGMRGKKLKRHEMRREQWLRP